jgi:hypothetical protein
MMAAKGFSAGSTHPVAVNGTLKVTLRKDKSKT